jgi:hypothetical protein
MKTWRCKALSRQDQAGREQDERFVLCELFGLVDASLFFPFFPFSSSFFLDLLVTFDVRVGCFERADSDFLLLFLFY